MTDPAEKEFELPEGLRDFISISVVDDGGFFIDPLFRRRYGSDAPRVPAHVVAFARTGPRDDAPRGALVPVCYVHFHRLGDMVLVGGLVTDGDALRALPTARQQAIRDAGGIALNMLRYGFHRFEDTDAHVGYCGDARAYEVDLQAGFRPTQHQYLLIHTPRPLAPAREAELIVRAHALGPF